MEGDFKLDQWLIQPKLNQAIAPDGTVSQFEPRIMELLAYLAEHAGEVLSRPRILEAVWGEDVVREEVLARAVSLLRSAFKEKDNDLQVVQTIPGRGYRLGVPVQKFESPLSRYKILKKLGQGAMGEVFLAKDTQLHRNLALKFLREGKDRGSRRQQVGAARAAAALDHPFICKIYDTGMMEGRTFIAMEFVEGITLKEKLKAGRMDLREVLQVASEVAEALETAHERGVVHRDLKPSNIMLTRQGHVKVMDFGVAASVVPRVGDELDATGSVPEQPGTRGSLPYMSPEQATGATIEPCSDIFSFGSVLYEMVTGRKAFQGSSPAAILAGLLRDEPRRAGELVDKLPAQVERIIVQCLRKDPRCRFRSMSDVRAEWLEKALAERDSAVIGLNTEPMYQGLHSDPRYTEMLRRMNLAT